MGSPYTPQPYSPQGGFQQAYPLANSALASNPPTQSWIIVLVLSAITGIYAPIHLIIQASWAKRATGSAKAMNLAFAAVGCFAVYFISVIIFMVGKSPMFALIELAGLLAYLVTLWMSVFAVRSAIVSRFGVEVSGVMTFFFTIIYLQYKLNQVTQGAALPPLGAQYPGQAPQFGAPLPPQYGQPQPPQYGQPQAPQYGQPQPPQPGAGDWNQTVPYGRPAFGSQPQPPQQPQYGQPQQAQPQQGQWPPQGGEGNNWPQR